MQDQISGLIEDLEHAESREEKERAITRLSQHGEGAIPALLAYLDLYPVRPTRRESVMLVLQRIGYPGNRKAIPFVVDIASDVNSPGREIAMAVLADIGSPVIPDVRDSLRIYIREPYKYSDLTQGLCQFLEMAGPTFIKPLMPELLELLKVGTDENYVDEYALWPLQRIGSPEADAAIPILQTKIISRRGPRIRRLSIEALRHFDPGSVYPLAPILRECLSDESDVIRASAGKILAWLNY